MNRRARQQPAPPAKAPPPVRRDGPAIPFSVTIYLPGEPRPWEQPDAYAQPTDEPVADAADTGPDSDAAWEKRLELVCPGCGLRNIDFIGRCRSCGGSKVKTT